MNSAIAPQDHRLAALQTAISEFDHDEDYKHDEELDLHADKILFQKLAFAFYTNRSGEEVAMVCTALEMVYRASRSRVALSFSELRESILPIFVEMLGKPLHIRKQEELDTALQQVQDRIQTEERAAAVAAAAEELTYATSAGHRASSRGSTRSLHSSFSSLKKPAKGAYEDDMTLQTYEEDPAKPLKKLDDDESYMSYRDDYSVQKGKQLDTDDQTYQSYDDGQSYQSYRPGDESYRGDDQSYMSYPQKPAQQQPDGYNDDDDDGSLTVAELSRASKSFRSHADRTYDDESEGGSFYRKPSPYEGHSYRGDDSGRSTSYHSSAPSSNHDPSRHSGRDSFREEDDPSMLSGRDQEDHSILSGRQSSEIDESIIGRRSTEMDADESSPGGGRRSSEMDQSILTGRNSAELDQSTVSGRQSAEMDQSINTGYHGDQSIYSGEQGEASIVSGSVQEDPSVQSENPGFTDLQSHAGSRNDDQSQHTDLE